MSDYLFLVPISLLLGLVGLLAFLWALRSDQYNDLEGAAARVLEEDDRPLVDQLPPNPSAQDPSIQDQQPENPPSRDTG